MGLVRSRRAGSPALNVIGHARGADWDRLVSALCFLFEAFLGRPRLALAIPRPKKERRLPEVLSPGEVARLLEKTRNHKHRVLLMLLYSAGLRVGELVRLRPANDAYISQAQATSPAACAAAASPGSA